MPATNNATHYGLDDTDECPALELIANYYAEEPVIAATTATTATPATPATTTNDDSDFDDDDDFFEIEVIQEDLSK